MLIDSNDIIIGKYYPDIAKAIPLGHVSIILFFVIFVLFAINYFRPRYCPYCNSRMITEKNNSSNTTIFICQGGSYKIDTHMNRY
ncbi:MAG TPA: hypothetical protein P5123_05725 [Spirochaetota bacterium]|nr:hypothetical protein [Spirochaetota bacterium]